VTPDQLIDYVAAVAVFWYAWRGVQRGFVVAMVGAFFVIAALVGAGWAVRTFFATTVPPFGLTSTAFAGATTLVLIVVVDRTRALVETALRGQPAATLSERPVLAYVDRIAGALPGALLGIIYVAVVASALVEASLLPSLPAGLSDSSGTIVPQILSLVGVSDALADGVTEAVVVSSVSPDNVVAGPVAAARLAPVASIDDPVAGPNFSKWLT
jgi:hypothetical protein